MKYLGFTYTLDNSTRTQLQITSTNLQKMCVRIASRRASAATKAAVYNMYVLAQLRYYGPHFTAPQTKLEKLFDEPVQTLLRKLTYNMQSFPTALLWIPRDKGGLGFRKPTDVINEAKLNMVNRSFSQSTHMSHTVTGMILGLERQQNQHWHLLQAGPVSIPPSPKYCWALSLIQRLTELGLTLSLNPRPLTRPPPPTHNIVDHLSEPVTLQQHSLLQLLSVHHIEDLAAPNSRRLQTLSYGNPDLQFLSALQPPPSYTEPTALTLRPGMAFLNNQDDTTSVLEFLGFSLNPLLVQIREWTQGPTRLTMDPATSRGAGTSTPANLRDINFRGLTRAIIKPSRTGATADLVHQHQSPPIVVPTSTAPVLPAWITRLLPLLPAIPDYHIYTDGSWSLQPHLSDLFLVDYGSARLPRVQATAGFVITPTDGSWEGERGQRLTTVYITDGNAIGAQSVYPMELLAMLASLQLARHLKNTQGSPVLEIVTDALGACNLANKLQGDPQSTPSYTPLIQPLTSLMQDFEGTLRWTKAHAEKRAYYTASWTRDECLNHIADKVAGGSLEFDVTTNGPTNHINITATELLEGLRIPDAWSLQSTDGSIPPLDKLQAHIDELRLRQYQLTRDQYRTADGRQERWQHTTPVYAAALFKQKKATLSTASRNIKIFMDKNWHGGNQAKGIKDPEERLLVSKCPLCDQQDSQDHWIRKCQGGTQRITRDQFQPELRRAIRDANDKFHYSSAIAMQITLDIAMQHPSGQDVWIGQWTPPLQNALLSELHRRRPGALRELTDSRIRNLRKDIMTIARILAEATSYVWRERQDTVQRLHLNAPPPTPRTPSSIRPSQINNDPLQPSVRSHFTPITPITPSTQPRTPSSHSNTTSASSRRIVNPLPYIRPLHQLHLTDILLPTPPPPETTLRTHSEPQAIRRTIQSSLSWTPLPTPANANPQDEPEAPEELELELDNLVDTPSPTIHPTARRRLRKAQRQSSSRRNHHLSSPPPQTCITCLPCRSSNSSSHSQYRNCPYKYSPSVNHHTPPPPKPPDPPPPNVGIG